MFLIDLSGHGRSGPMALLFAGLAAVALLLRTPGEWFDWIWPAAFAVGAVANTVAWWRAWEAEVR